MLIMRRFLVVLMLCLLPFQMSWATVADYCGHEQGKSTQHFGHHDDEHKWFSDNPDSDKQPGKFDLGHDHCHMSSFLGILNETAFIASVSPVLPSFRCDQRVYSSLALDRPERPKWQILA